MDSFGTISIGTSLDLAGYRRDQAVLLRDMTQLTQSLERSLIKSSALIGQQVGRSVAVEIQRTMAYEFGRLEFGISRALAGQFQSAQYVSRQSAKELAVDASTEFAKYWLTGGIARDVTSRAATLVGSVARSVTSQKIRSSTPASLGSTQAQDVGELITTSGVSGTSAAMARQNGIDLGREFSGGFGKGFDPTATGQMAMGTMVKAMVLSQGIVALGTSIAGQLTGAIAGSLPGQINSIFREAISGGGGLREAINLQLSEISQNTAFSALAKVDTTTAKNVLNDLNTQLAVSAAALPGVTTDYQRLAGAINDNLIAAYKKLDGTLDTGRFLQGTKSIAESYGALTASSTKDIGNTSLGLTKAMGGASIAELRTISFFEQNPQILAEYERRLNEIGAKSLRDLTQEGRAALIKEAGEKFITQDFKDTAGQSVDGLLQAFKSKLFDPKTGVFGLMRDLDTELKGDQSVFSSFNSLVAALIGESSENMGFVQTLAKEAKASGLVMFEPLVGQRAALEGAIGLINQAKASLPGLFSSELFGSIVRFQQLVLATFGDLAKSIGSFATGDLLGLLAGGFDRMSQALSLAGPIIGTAFEAARPILVGVATAAGQLTQTLLNLGQQALPLVLSGINAIGSIGGAAFNGIAGLLGGATTAASGVFGPAKETGLQGEGGGLAGPIAIPSLDFGSIASGVRDFVENDLAPMIHAGFVSSVEGLKGLLATVFDPALVEAGFALLGDTIKNVFSTAGSLALIVRDNFQWVFGLVETVLPTVPLVLNAASAVLAGLAGGVQQITESVASIWNDYGAQIQTMIGAAAVGVAALAPALVDVGSILGDLFSISVNLVSGFFSNPIVLNSLGAIVVGINYVADALAVVANWTKEVLDVPLIRDGVLVALTAIGGVLAGPTVMGAIGAISAGFASVTAFVSSIGAGLSAVGAVLSGPIVGTMALVVGAGFALKQLVQDLPKWWQGVVDITTAYYNILALKIGEAWTAIAKTAAGVWDGIKSAIGGPLAALGKITTDISTTIGKWVSSTVTMVDKATGLGNAFKGVANWASNILESLKGAFPALQNLLSLAGSMNSGAGNQQASENPQSSGPSALSNDTVKKVFGIQSSKDLYLLLATALTEGKPRDLQSATDSAVSIANRVNNSTFQAQYGATSTAQISAPNQYEAYSRFNLSGVKDAESAAKAVAKVWGVTFEEALKYVTELQANIFDGNKVRDSVKFLGGAVSYRASEGPTGKYYQPGVDALRSKGDNYYIAPGTDESYTTVKEAKAATQAMLSLLGQSTNGPIQMPSGPQGMYGPAFTQSPGGGNVLGARGGGIYTAPESTNGGSSAYHIDSKFLKSVSLSERIQMMDALGNFYAAQGRVIEFSNQAVAGLRWDINKSQSEKEKLLLKAQDAHSHSVSAAWDSIDYYIPKKGGTRFDQSAENAEIALPEVKGSRVEYGKGGRYGAYAVIVDASGRDIFKTGHGDESKALPGNYSAKGGPSGAGFKAPSSLSPSASAKPNTANVSSSTTSPTPGGQSNLALQLDPSAKAERALEDYRKRAGNEAKLLQQSRKEEDARLAAQRKIREEETKAQRLTIAPEDTEQLRQFDAATAARGLEDQLADLKRKRDRDIADLEAAKREKAAQTAAYNAKKAAAETELKKGNTPGPDMTPEALERDRLGINPIDLTAAIREVDSTYQLHVKSIQTAQENLATSTEVETKKLLAANKSQIESFRRQAAAKSESIDEKYNEQIRQSVKDHEEAIKPLNQMIENLERLLPLQKVETAGYATIAEQLAEATKVREDYVEAQQKSIVALERERQIRQAIDLQRADQEVYDLGKEMAASEQAILERQARAMEKRDPEGAQEIREQLGLQNIAVQLADRLRKIDADRLDLQRKLAEAQRTGNTAIISTFEKAGLGSNAAIDARAGKLSDNARTASDLDRVDLLAKDSGAFGEFRKGVAANFASGFKEGLMALAKGETDIMGMLKGGFMKIWEGVMNAGAEKLTSMVTDGIFGDGGLFGKKKDPAEKLPQAGQNAGQSLAQGGEAAGQAMISAAERAKGILGSGQATPLDQLGFSGLGDPSRGIFSMFGGEARPLDQLSFGGAGTLGGLFGGTFLGDGGGSSGGFDWGGAGVQFGDAFSQTASGFGAKEGQGFGGILSSIFGGGGGGLGGLFGGGAGGAAGGESGGGLGGILGIGMKLLGGLFGGGFNDGGPTGSSRTPKTFNAIAEALRREGPGGFLGALGPNEFVIQKSATQHYGGDFLAKLNRKEIKIPNFADGGPTSPISAKGISAHAQEAGVKEGSQFVVEYQTIGSQDLVTLEQVQAIVSRANDRTVRQSVSASQRSISQGLKGNLNTRRGLGFA